MTTAHTPSRRATRRLADTPATVVDAAITERSILIVPIGATEQHGDHLPLGTDTFLAQSFADAAAERFGDELDLWVLPTLAVTKSDEHAWSAGTLWLSADTMLSTMREIGNSVAMLGARKLVLLNSHGGNSGLLDVACREIRRATGLQTFLVHPVLPPDHGGHGADDEHGFGIHGGIDETSLMLHLHPDLVDLDAAVRNVPEWMGEYEHVRFGGTVGFGWTSDDFGPAGVIGDATLATAEHGEHLFEACLRTLADGLREVARFDFPDSASAPSPDLTHDL
ncbi:creatininase family protein [Ilumatobacter coccineus]|uniref:Putative creatinine amidohydrolase n=1 Tax=Ilumatobacter coccineus (strain NBRC 103263 / KCTC 29153 / YM16-304) TaxID=1313172 RepID=A0A6C7E9H3_ILUCY|nr:creatininase family protein [Ilumatobacter coccineus]BAN04304.1 putative creatinine amidohydrolase [Ilumatobacter coccineus YM16-304]